jgi:hypothetical protein
LVVFCAIWNGLALDVGGGRPHIPATQSISTLRKAGGRMRHYTERLLDLGLNFRSRFTVHSGSSGRTDRNVTHILDQSRNAHHDCRVHLHDDSFTLILAIFSPSCTYTRLSSCRKVIAPCPVPPRVFIFKERGHFYQVYGSTGLDGTAKPGTGNRGSLINSILEGDLDSQDELFLLQQEGAYTSAYELALPLLFSARSQPGRLPVALPLHL